MKWFKVLLIITSVASLLLVAVPLVAVLYVVYLLIKVVTSLP